MSTEPGIVGQPSVSMGKKRPNAMEWVRVFNRSALIQGVEKCRLGYSLPRLWIGEGDCDLNGCWRRVAKE